MRADSSNDPPPLWKVAVICLATVLAWPALIAAPLWRARQFHRVARKASGYRYRITEDGVEAWRDHEPPRRISWARLAAGRWLVYVTPTMASGDEESYAVDLPEEGVALSGDLLPLVIALSDRQLSPTIEDGGRALGAGGWVVTMLWIGAAFIAVLVGLWQVAS